MSGSLSLAFSSAVGTKNATRATSPAVYNELGINEQELKIQQQLAEYARRPYDKTLFRDNKYVAIHPGDIRLAQTIWNFDSSLRTAFNLNVNAALGGNLMLERKNKQLPKQMNELICYFWLEFIRAALRDKWLYGFVIWTWVPQPIVGAIPRVVPPDQVEAMYHQNILGEAMWAVRETGADQGIFGRNEDTQPFDLENFYVYTWDVPDKNGRLRSPVIVLSTNLTYLEGLKQCSIRAEMRRSFPAIITEHVECKTDPNWDNVFDKHRGIVSGSELERERERLGFVERRAEQMNRFANSMTREEFMNYTNDCMMIQEARNSDFIGPRLDLPNCRKLARHPLPEAPADLLKWKLQMQQEVFMLFGIPPSMIQAESSKGKINLDVNAQAVYNNHLRNLKQQMLTFANLCYKIIHSFEYAEQFLVRTPLTEQVTEEDVEQNSTVEITMPGIPPENILQELYQQGILKYDAYKKYISSNYSIPMEHLEAKAKLSVLDLLNGGKEKLKPAAGAGAKKRKSTASAKPKAKPKKKKQKRE